MEIKSLEIDTHNDVLRINGKKDNRQARHCHLS